MPSVLKPGKYTVVVQSPNHAAAWRTVVVGEVLSSHQFILEPGEYISGKVVDDRARPVAGAAVGWVQPIRGSGRNDETPELQTMTATDTDGKFILGPLPPGEFQISAVAESPRRVGKVILKTGEAKVIVVTPRP
jgi:hypothetical protein